ncbi:collagen alpha-1(ii) chain [Plakobranchus ocellatus]|uniref:Collagen alpha-1(Ii) chain n=1 Tax=Plakobranchus ocellatus TaxID=259542 RepID=A0AAV3ZLK6_9GAST|nr:collagen alpha-1(ii) chain [Plakobranchus ocellatus]
MRVAIFCLVGLVLVAVDVIPALPVADEEPVVELTLGCMRDGQRYEVGSTYEEPCKYCYCMPGNVNFTCASIMCDWPSCPAGWVIKTPPGSCCPICAQP